MKKPFKKKMPVSRAFRRRPVRRGQIITPFGVGAINDFRNDEALMCAGLDKWFDAAPDPSLVIHEERLQNRLRCTHFVKPPEFGEGEGASKLKIPHVRFPLWHYCPRCFVMEKTTLFGGQPRCTACAKKGGVGRRMIPVRIVAICEAGHIQDFPFQEWIKCSCGERERRLFFRAGRSAASLAGIKIKCENCGKERSLAGAFHDGAIDGCKGGQPWLGRESGVRSCDRALKTVQRGGSNVYFPLVASSIYIPPERGAEDELITRILETPRVWEALSSAIVDGRVPEAACIAFAGVYGVDANALAAAVQARLEGRNQIPIAASDEEFRHQEYKVLSAGGGTPLDDLFVETRDGTDYDWLARCVRRVGLVRKLRETRVHVGFSRVFPKGDRGDEGVQPLAANKELGWLPAIEVRGEGIFVELDATALAAWASSPKVTARAAALVQAYNRRSGRAPRTVDARFVMIHTLAHALIKELTFACGYGSSSLRERIYCNQDPKSPAMNGFLVYTASGDAEGTLGGLVAQAAPGRFEALVHDALVRSSWCSNDPVCMESPDGGAYSSNFAACHSCVLLPETSCEEGNRLLDRALLCGSIDEPELAFFHEMSFAAS